MTALAEVGRLRRSPGSAPPMDGDRIAAPMRRSHRPLDRHAARATVGRRVRELLDEQLPGQDLRLVYARPAARRVQAHYAIVANPFLWFLQHQLYTLPYEPNVDDALIEAWQNGYRPANRGARRGRRRGSAAASSGRSCLLQDYHLYLAAAQHPRAPAGRLAPPLQPHPVAAGDSGWCCRRAAPRDLRGAAGERHRRPADRPLRRPTSSTPWRASCATRGSTATAATSAGAAGTIWVRAYPISIDPDALAEFARGPEVGTRRDELASDCERAGNPRLIVRVDRLEPSKNALRGFLAFEALLHSRPDLRERPLPRHPVDQPRERRPRVRALRRGGARGRRPHQRLADPDEAPIWLLDGSDYALAIAALPLPTSCSSTRSSTA